MEQRTDVAAARRTAVALLARRDFACAELAGRLRAEAFDETTALAVIEALKQERVLDDVRFAQNYVVYRARRGQGPLRIGADLRRQGLAPADVEAALAAGPDWYALASSICRAKFGPQPPQNWAQKAQQARFLQYRGFSSDHIRAATGADPDLD